MKIDDLPAEVLLSIFEFVSTKDINTIRSVNRKWAAISNASVLRRRVRIVLRNTDIDDNHPYFQLVRNSSMKFPNLQIICPRNIQKDLPWHQTVTNLKTLKISSANGISFVNWWWVQMLHSTHELNSLSIDICKKAILNDEYRRYLNTQEFQLQELKEVVLAIDNENILCEFLKLLTKFADKLNTFTLYAIPDHFNFITDLRLLIQSTAAKLSTLALFYCHHDILSPIAKITDLKLKKLKWISPYSEDINSLVTFLHNQRQSLSTLYITIVSRKVYDILLTFINLEYLTIELYEKEAVAIDALVSCNKLKYLHIIVRYKEGNLTCTSNIHPMPNLKKLQINYCYEKPMISLGLYKGISNAFTSLNELCLDNIQTMGISLLMETLTEIRVLDLTIAQVDPHVDPAALHNISNLKKLEICNLHKFEHILNDDYFEKYFHFSKLHTLFMTNCGSNITDRGMIAIANNCPALRSIKVHKFPLITDYSIEYLTQNLPFLYKLNTRGSLLLNGN